FLAEDALYDVPTRACLQCAIDFFLVRMRREDEDASVGKFANYLYSTSGATHAGQSKVQHYQVGMVFAIEFQGGLAVSCFGHDFNVRLHIQRAREPHPDHEVIVNHQNTYWF